MKPNHVPDRLKISTMLATFLAVTVMGQTPTVDLPDRLKATLVESKLTYADIGNFLKIEYTIKNKPRRHSVHLRKAADSYLSLQGHEIYGLVWESEIAPTTDQFLTWSQKRYVLGGLVFEKPSENQKFYRLRFRLHVQTTCSLTELKDSLSITASTADAIEAELNPGAEDKF